MTFIAPPPTLLGMPLAIILPLSPQSSGLWRISIITVSSVTTTKYDVVTPSNAADLFHWSITILTQFPTNSTHFSQFCTGLKILPLYILECCIRSSSWTAISISSLLWNQHPSNRRFSSPKISSSAAAKPTSVLDVLGWPMSVQTFSISLHQFLI